MGIGPADSMAGAGRKMLRAYFKSMVDNEAGTLEGVDPEALHDMRVATRRMRAVLRVLQPYLAGQKADEVRRGVRDVTRALGGVRDLDVLIEHAQRFQAGLSVEQRDGMDDLLAEWQSQRKGMRKRLVRTLSSGEYKRFKKRMEKFLAEAVSAPDQTAGAQPYQVRHVAAGAIWPRGRQGRSRVTIEDRAKG